MPGVIDGKRWIAERLKFLRECLAANPSDEERQAIEAEIQALLAPRRRLVPSLPWAFIRRRRSG